MNHKISDVKTRAEHRIAMLVKVNTGLGDKMQKAIHQGIVRTDVGNAGDATDLFSYEADELCKHLSQICEAEEVYDLLDRMYGKDTFQMLVLNKLGFSNVNEYAAKKSMMDEIKDTAKL